MNQPEQNATTTSLQAARCAPLLRQSSRGGGRTLRRSRVALALLVCTILTLALGVASAGAAAPSTTMGTVSEASYTSAHVTGTVHTADHAETYYSFETSTDGVNWSSFSYLGPLPENAGATNVSSDLGGLVPGTHYLVRLAAMNFDEIQEVFSPGPNPEFSTSPMATPTITTPAVSAVTGTAAEFSAEINPQAPAGNPAAFDVNWYFECTPGCPGLAGGTIAADHSVHTVSAHTSGLQPNTAYTVTLYAASLGESASAGPVSFTTEAPAPTAQTLEAGSIQASSATLTGRINPLNSPVTYSFEWGTSESYGNNAPVAPASLAADNTYHVVTAPLEGLQGATTYHYRIVATNPQTHSVSRGADRTFTTSQPAAGVPAPCPNEASRTGASAKLPDCRAYEFASPGLNGSSIGPPNGHTLADGSAIGFQVVDAPDNAVGSGTFAWVISRRGAEGWATESVVPGFVEPADGFNPSAVESVSADLSTALVLTPQPVAGPSSPSGDSVYLRHADGTYTPVMKIGNPYFPGPQTYNIPLDTEVASPDYSHVWYWLVENQLGSGPNATWEWSDGEVRALGVLPGPGRVVAPEGANLAAEPEKSGHGLGPMSANGKHVLFNAVGFSGLYLQSNGEESVEVSASQRTVNADPNPPATPTSFGVTADGSTVLFTSASELTNDANTGQSGGTANDQGSDLYSYDAQSGKLTDLTVDTNPADQATGADVQYVLKATSDASFIYFLAKGDLAPGGVSGDENLYVEHEGKIDFIAPGDGMATGFAYSLAITPSGRIAAFTSTDPLTGYDNADPQTGNRQIEVYKYTYGAGLECASCRPGGAPAGADPVLIGRSLSDDGSRLFFQSTGAVVPQAANGRQNVFEYEGGEIHLISSGDANADSILLDASASGDDVFFMTHQELVPEGQGTVSAVYDARVGAVTKPAATAECSGEGCLGGASAAPVFGAPASATPSGTGNVARAPVVKAKKVTKAKPKPRCKKGFVRKRNKCVRQKAKKSSKATRTQRRGK